MIRRCLEDLTCCVATHKGSLIVCQISASVLTQPTARADLALRVARG